MVQKRCPQCHFTNTKKDGKHRNKQRYYCYDCQSSWTNKSRPPDLTNEVWRQFAFEQRTIKQLCTQFGKCRKWVKNHLDDYRPPKMAHRPRPVVLIMDATYFGRSWGVLVGFDSLEDEVIYLSWLSGTERTSDYELVLDTLKTLSYQIKAVVIDGRRGVKETCLSRGLPVQHCQFHQLLTITQCLTKRPKLEANKDLRDIALTLTRTTHKELEARLNVWHAKYDIWLKERDPDTNQFKHQRTRRAYFSLRRNLPYLFTCQTLIDAKVPNTTNKLDGRFGVWKTALKRHRGCSKALKTKLLISFLSGASD